MLMGSRRANAPHSRRADDTTYANRLDSRRRVQRDCSVSFSSKTIFEPVNQPSPLRGKVRDMLTYLPNLRNTRLLVLRLNPNSTVPRIRRNLEYIAVKRELRPDIRCPPEKP